MRLRKNDRGITQSINVHGENRIRTAEKWWGWGRRGKRKDQVLTEGEEGGSIRREIDGEMNKRGREKHSN